MTRRFSWVTEGKSFGPNPTCDHDLWEHASAAVVPSLGAVVPYWYLVVPRVSALSFRQLRQELRVECLQLAREIGSRFEEGADFIYFEHGAANSSSSVSCGTDQAHLHVVMLDFDLMGKISARSEEISWIDTDLQDPWAQIPVDRDYHLIVSEERAVWWTPSNPTSQYFRQVIAEAAGVPGRWDYREWPHDENVLKSRRKLTQLQKLGATREHNPARRTTFESRAAST